MRPSQLHRRSSLSGMRRQHSRRPVLEVLESRLAPTTDFFANPSALMLNGALFTGSGVQLTNGTPNQASSVFTKAQQGITQFTTQFTFTDTNASGGGMTFTIQNDPRGPAAIGGPSSGLGYGQNSAGDPKIVNSVAIKFDLFDNATNLPSSSTGIYTNGASPTVPSTDLAPFGIDFHSGHQFLVTLTYDGSTLTETIHDNTTGTANFTTSYNVNIPAIVGGNAAYVGFTGGSGGFTAIQTIQSWQGTFGSQTSGLTITSLTPTAVTAGSGPFTLFVNGSGFVSGAMVQWTQNGSTTTLTPFLTTGNQLRVLVPSTLITTSNIGAASVRVIEMTGRIPLVSNTVAFTINPSSIGIPVISSLSPSTMQQNSGGFTLTVNGSGFVSGATVQLNGITLPTTFLNAGQLNAFVSSSQLTTAGSFPLTVTQFNGQSTVISTPVTFTVTPFSNLVFPIISTLSPNTVQQGSGGFTLTINGSGFVSGATVQLNGTTLPTSFVNGGQLNAFVSSSMLTTAGSVPVTVTEFNGQTTVTSSPVTFTVSPFSSTNPAITSLSPGTVQQNSGGFTLTVNGSNFVSGAVLQLNGTSLPTAFVNSGQLTAFVSSSMLGTAGTLPVVVSQFNGQSTVTSNTVFFTITPTSSTSPTITSLSPNPVVQSNSTFTLTVFGSNFVSPATVQLVRGTTTITLSATVTSSNQLQVSIPGSLLTPGSVSVTVSGPNGTSNAATLVVTSTIAAPTISTISPSSVQQNSAGFTLSVFGSNFVSGATVQLNGASLPTSFISSNQLSAFVSSSFLTNAGSSSITVSQFNGQGTVTSNAVTLTVTPISNLLIPVISSISPSSVQQNSAGFTLSVSGSNFVPGATVQLNGTNLPTSFVSSSQLSAFVSSAFLTSAGSLSITVSQFNGQSTVTSNVMTLTVRQQTTTTITATGLNITATANVAQDFTVAQFTDSAPNAQPGAYAVSVDFGDGTAVQSGHVTQPGGPGTTFFVDATHTYTQTGTFTVHVRIFKEVGGSAETFSTATVAAAGAPQAPGGGGAASAGKNLLFTQAVGQGLTATANTNVAPLQASTAVQSGQSSSADDLYWQLVGQGQGFTESNDLVAGQLASALDGATL